MSEIEAQLVIQPGMTAKAAAEILAHVPQGWRVEGRDDGSIAVGRKANDEAET